MNREEWFNKKFSYLKKFFIAAICGAALAYAGIVKGIDAITIIGVLLCIPFFLWLLMVPVFHWKDRYIGTNSGVWGFFLVFETSSWSKILYWFLNVIPDLRKSGKYRNVG